MYAAAGHDIGHVDQLAGGVVVPAEATVTAPGGARTVAAAGLRPDPQEPEDEAGYRALFGTCQAGERIADAREVAAKAAVAALTDDQVFESLFGQVSPAAAPVAASAAGLAGQHNPGAAGQQRWRVHAPRVSLRVPRNPGGLAAGAEPGKTLWRVIDLHGGDLVPADAHPADITRLRLAKNRLGPLIKPW